MFYVFQSVVNTDLYPKLFGYLQPTYTPYHVRTVQLLWDVQDIIPHHDFESVIAKTVASQRQGQGDAYEAFGVLWRLTGYVRLCLR